MCAVSMISQYQWPTPVRSMDDDTKRLLREVVQRLDQIDKRLNDRDCFDEEKKKFLAAIRYEEEVG